jgi:GNAT superfamily N-acetyltransferase
MTIFFKFMLRIISLNDAPELTGLLACWHHEQWAYLYPGDTVNARIKRMQSYLNDSFIPSTFVALTPTPAGSAAIIENDMETRPALSPWLASVFVKAGERRKGIGSALVRHAVEQARQHDINQLFLFTPDQQQFYQRLGWKYHENTTYHGEQVTIMVYPLCTNPDRD